MRATILPAAVLAGLALATPASAARIAISSQDCGTPDLLGLSFTIGTLDACEAGMVTDPGQTTPLYGDPITFVAFTTDFGGNLADVLEVDEELSDLPIITFSGSSFSLSGGSIDLGCTDLPCDISELTIRIFLDGTTDLLGTRFTVTQVNDVVPEPGALLLLSSGLLAAAGRRLRRRRSPRLT